MSDSRRASRAPWITAGVAGVVFVVLLVLLLVPVRHARDSFTNGQFSADEQRAMDAAATETVNIVSLRRAHYQADFNRALAGATGALRSDILAKKATTQKTLIAGKFDLSARATHQALVGPAGNNGYVILVTIQGYKSSAPNTPVPSNLQVTVTDKNGKYLVSNVMNIGIA